MKHPRLTLFTIAFISLATFLLFALSLRPIKIQFNEPEIKAGSIEKPIVTFVNPSLGKNDAQVTIIEYGDFLCGACSEVTQNLKRIQSERPNTVKIIWKNLPNNGHNALSEDAALAAMCAHQQGKFWEYHDGLFANQSLLTKIQLGVIAEEIGLDTRAFNNCLNSKDTLPAIIKDRDEAIGLGLIATPTIFIGEEQIIGSVSYSELNSYVEKELVK